MNYTKMITTTAIVIALFASCSKENFNDYPNNQKATELNVNENHSKRGNEEEVGIYGIVSYQGGKGEINNGTLKAFNMDKNMVTAETPVDGSGNFTIHLSDGPYVFEFFMNGNFVGASEVVVVEGGTTNLTLEF